MLLCPKCECRLVHSKTELGYIFNCPDCEGRSASFSVLRRAAGRPYVNQLLRRAREVEGDDGPGCPCCAKPMVEVPAGDEGHPLLDICSECQFVWFDHQEFEQLPPADAAEAKEVHPDAREPLAMADAVISERMARGAEFGGKAPAEWWKWVPAFMGMPVEHDVDQLRSQPWVTWGIAGVMIAVTLLTMGKLDPIIQSYGLIPAEWDRLGGLTVLTSFFLHAGVFHLVGNAYFLLIFGDNVEDYLGKVRYLLLIAAAAVVGDVAHIYMTQWTGGDLTVPSVGASGGISGVITYYAMRFPRARLGIMLRFWILFKWLYMPAYFALILWFGLQVFGVWAQVAGISNVSALAHLGGAAVGLLAWLIWRDS